MKRIVPNEELINLPCSVVAVSCALDSVPKDLPELKPDGYATLKAANKFIRKHLDVQKYVSFKRFARPKLKDIVFESEAIVCILGHFIYVKQDIYYSFFDNDNDPIVAIWFLKGTHD